MYCCGGNFQMQFDVANQLSIKKQRSKPRLSKPLGTQKEGRRVSQTNAIEEGNRDEGVREV